MEIDPKDYKIDVYTNPDSLGGQQVGTIDVFVRVTYKANTSEEIIFESNAERSQMKNKEKVLKLLEQELERRSNDKTS